MSESKDYLSDGELVEARRREGIDPSAFVVALVGGWWPYKDNQTVVDAVAQLGRPVVLIGGGTPIDVGALQQLETSHYVDLRVVARRLSASEVRRVYATSSVTVVSRRPGEGTESGLVMDAARYGVPLICSDHDPVLSATLRGLDWVHTFPSGDARGLAGGLEHVADHPPPRPGPEAARLLGLLDGEGLLNLYDVLAPSTRQ